MAKEYKEKKITVNLSKVFLKPATKTARAAVFLLRKKIVKETRAKKVLLSNAVNEALWQYGRGGSPRKITVKVINDKGTARAYLPDEKVELKEEVKKEKGLKAKAEDIAKGKEKSEEAPKEEKSKVENKKITEEKTSTENKKETVEKKTETDDKKDTQKAKKE